MLNDTGFRDKGIEARFAYDLLILRFSGNGDNGQEFLIVVVEQLADYVSVTLISIDIDDVKDLVEYITENQSTWT